MTVILLLICMAQDRACLHPVRVIFSERMTNWECHEYVDKIRPYLEPPKGKILRLGCPKMDAIV